ncbi:Zinc finger, C3HC-like protein [Metarhizium album ARSEF 1941]|uniref:Zinc finger, C3HC-like protein n=1 Tax=Metarhizium album (strain ARSEF 1941) TaxID=1081103 RepID=A0A0B2WR21_METAS|nr:Zinc finger, C3HC-like protein [Metarhizium album ARSEF 1941]KHN95942.1 Zinc finger, C3HC-like protein [Metarhizium album ARSEF 1941]
MNATKRKFKDLLQGLSSTGPTTPDRDADNMSSSPRHGAGTTSNDTILQKRRRFGFPESMTPTLYAPSHATTLSNVVLRRSGTQLNGKTTSHAPAKYCPGDRDELLKRLATFQEITDWAPKPDRVSEIEWAKRGWICQGKEKVRCVLCHKELIVRLNRKESDGKEVPVLVSSDIAEALVDKYSELIVSSHQQDCLWRNRGCDDTLIRLSFSNTSTTLARLRERYDELCTRSSFLPYEFNLRLPDGMDIDSVLSQLPPDFFTETPPVVDKSGAASLDKPPNKAALALALLGWQGLTNSRIGPVPNSASCHTCLRRLGLWMFKSKEVDDEGQVVVPAPMDHLDPLREHRFFCPWKNPQAQSRGGTRPGGEDSPAGWRALLQTIKNESDLRHLYTRKVKRGEKTQEQGLGLASPSPARGAYNMPRSPSPVIADPTRSVDAPSIAAPQTAAGGDDEKSQEAKDKERWARLRNVKRLFDSKGSRKFRRQSGRPGSGHSNKSTTGAS